MNNTAKQKIISWSDGRKNVKLVQKGGEILKTIGGDMILVDFIKNDGNWTSNPPIHIFVKAIGDFDPMTCTYKITYQKEKEEKEENLRITPEGFSFNDPENDGWMKRFVTYSQHFKIMEEELYYARLRELFNNNEGVLGPTQLSQFATGKNKKERLGIINYISAVIDSDVPGGVNEGILAFRVTEISRVNKIGKNWEIGVRDENGDYFYIQKFKEDPQWIVKGFSVNGVVLGDLKFIDIEK